VTAKLTIIFNFATEIVLKCKNKKIANINHCFVAVILFFPNVKAREANSGRSKVKKR
jgi:hypothetical protein